MAALLAERRQPRRIAINLTRNNVRGVRGAVVGEVARLRSDDRAALCEEPTQDTSGPIVALATLRLAVS